MSILWLWEFYGSGIWSWVIYGVCVCISLYLPIGLLIESVQSGIVKLGDVCWVCGLSIVAFIPGVNIILALSYVFAIIHTWVEEWAEEYANIPIWTRQKKPTLTTDEHIDLLHTRKKDIEGR